MTPAQIDAAPRTDWFSGYVRPVRSGVYERRYARNSMLSVIRFSHYDHANDTWGMGALTPNDAEWMRWERAPAQRLPWRGLTQPAE